MKPPDASMAPAFWLAPLLGLAEEGGESAAVVGYGLTAATSVLFSLIFAVIGRARLHPRQHGRVAERDTTQHVNCTS